MIDYDDLRKKAEAAIRGETSWSFSPKNTLQLLRIIAVAKHSLKIASYSTTLAEIAKIENEE